MAPYQEKFPALLVHYGRVDDALNFAPAIRQIWIPKNGVTDRGITCHVGYEWSAILPASIPNR
jgi:hypothetical protein